MTTLSEAREAIYEAFNIAWTPTGYALTFDNETFVQPNDPWARLVVRHDVSTQFTLGPSGSRQYSRQGAAVVQVFTPINQGTSLADTLATTARNSFEGLSLSGTTIVFRDVIVREIGPDDKWYQINIEANFEYFEER